MTLEELLNDGDWCNVFADDGNWGGGNVTKDVEAVGVCPKDPPPTREDVVKILASVDGENDGPHWQGVFLLRDGRYLFADGSCDYTGWD